MYQKYFLVLYLTFIARQQSANGQRNQVTGPPSETCEVQGGRLAPGQHSLDVDTCVVWHCSLNSHGEAELEEFTCKEIDKYFQRTYPMFWNDCEGNACL